MARMPRFLSEYLQYILFIAIFIGAISFIYLGFTSCSHHFERSGKYWEEYQTNLVHKGNCSQADFASNDIYEVTTYRKARANGYEPCSYCLPEAAYEYTIDK